MINRTFIVIVPITISQLFCSSVLVYHLSQELCVKNNAKIALGEFTVMAYWSGKKISIASDDFREKVLIELSKRFNIVPTEFFDEKLNEVIEKEVEDILEKKLEEDGNKEIDPEQLEALKEQIRIDLDIFEMHLKTAKLLGARYMVNGFAYWNEKASVPRFRNVVLYLYEVDSKTELISAHHEGYARRDEIFAKLIPFFGDSIEYRFCIKQNYLK